MLTSSLASTSDERNNNNKRYPDELLQYLRLTQLNKDQLRGRTLEDLMFEKKQTDVNELMVLDSLAEACKATIAGYPTTVRTGRERKGRQVAQPRKYLISRKCALFSVGIVVEMGLDPSGAKNLIKKKKCLWLLLEEHFVF